MSCWDIPSDQIALHFARLMREATPGARPMICAWPDCEAEGVIGVELSGLGNRLCLDHADRYLHIIRSAISKMAHAVERATKELKG